jgi:L-fuculose-phosphate aldolase
MFGKIVLVIIYFEKSRRMDEFENEIREDILDIGRRLTIKGLIRGSQGSISVRLNKNRIIITPPKCPIGYIKLDDLMILDEQGHLPKGKPFLSTDFPLHKLAYQIKPETVAVIIAHPPITTAFSISDRIIQQGVFPEFDFLFPRGVPNIPHVPNLPYDQSDIIQEALTHYETMILSGRGTLSVGRSLSMAWLNIEHLEACMEVYFYSECLSAGKSLTEKQVNLLRDRRKFKKSLINPK